MKYEQNIRLNIGLSYGCGKKEGRDMIKIFDTHAHYDDEAFADDRDELIQGFPKQNIMAVTNIGTDLKTSSVIAEMTRRYENFYGTVGIYPTEVEELEKAEGSAPNKVIEALRELVQDNEKLVAIGEIGLDYHYMKPPYTSRQDGQASLAESSAKALQKKWFAGQMQLARELKLPIVVHSRDAARDTVEVMRQSHAEEIGGVVHCYSYTKELARDFLDMDFYFGIGGVITFKNARKLKEAVAYIPMERIVLETDSPYLTPEPYRGRRNTSLYLPYVARAIAELKGISEEAVYEITWENAHALYRLA